MSTQTPRAHLTAGTLEPALRVLQAEGHDLAPILRTAELDGVTARRFDQRVSVAQCKLVWDLVAETCDDRGVGIRAAMMLEPGDFDVLDFVMASATTFGQAVAALERHQRLVHSAAEMVLSYEGAHVMGTLRSVRDEPVSDYFVEFILASWTVVARRLLDPEFSYEEVCFVHARPEDTTLHEQFFAAPLRFSCPFDGVTTRAEFIDAPVASANAKLHGVLERHAQDLTASLHVHDDFVTQVRSSIFARIGRKPISAGAMAQSLGLSERSFRRRLQGQEVRYSELLDQVRQHLARRWLIDPDRRVGDIALSLGYSDQSGLERSVQRWMGMSLAKWRETLRNEAP